MVVMGAVLAINSDSGTARGYNMAAPLFGKGDTFQSIPRLLLRARWLQIPPCSRIVTTIRNDRRAAFFAEKGRIETVQSERLLMQPETQIFFPGLLPRLYLYDNPNKFHGHADSVSR